MVRLLNHLLPYQFIVAVLAFGPGFAIAVDSPVAKGTGTPAKATGATTATPGAAKKPNIVAIVNGHPISRQVLADECLRRYGKDVLESMVSKYLVLQECAKSNIVVTEADVNAEVERIAKKFGLSTERYMQMLHEERDISPSDYKQDIVWPMLCLQRLTADKVQVTQEEFNQAYNSQFGPAVKCRMIMCSSQEKMTTLHQQVVADPSQFGRLALEESEDEVSASVRGLIPPVRRHAGDTKFEEVAFSLNENQIGVPFQIGDQWILLQCVKRMPATQPDPKSLPVIQQQITDEIRERKTREIATELFKTLQQQAQVVNTMNDPELKKQYPGVAALINGRPVPLEEVAEESIKRNGRVVLDGEVNRKILEQELQKRKLQVTQADIDAELAHTANLYGYVKEDGSPDVEKWLKVTLAESGDDITADLYLRDAVWPSVALKKLTGSKVQVSDEDLRKGFESNYGPRAEVLAIVLSDQRTAQKVWEIARSNPDEQFFAELASQYSIEPVSRNNFGKVPPIRRYGGQPMLEQEAFGLQPGQLSGIVATGNQYIIMRSQGFTKPVVTDFEAVREELSRDLVEKKLRLAMADEFDRLSGAASIDNFLTGTSQSGVQPATAKAPSGIAPIAR